MSAIVQRKIVCDACGRAGVWKPEFAGKKIKCKCGHVIQVPAAATGIAPTGVAPATAQTRQPSRAVAAAHVVTAPHEDNDAPITPEPLAAEKDAGGDDLYDLREDDTKPMKKLPTLGAPMGAVAPALVSKGKATAAKAAAPAGQMPGSNRLAYATPKAKGADAANAEEKARTIKLLVMFGAAVLVVGLAIAGMKFLGHGSKPAGPQLGEDADIQAKLDDEPHKEIHEWFAENHDRIMGGWTPSKAMGYADMWQKMGAKQVIAFGATMSMVAVIELPTDQAQRDQLFHWQAEYHKEHNEKVWTDVGQKYLMIRVSMGA